jgi:hypothetical protein
MIYIIISNVGLALMMIFVYIRYSRFRILSGSEIRELRKKFDQESEARKVAEDQVMQTTKTDDKKIEELLREIDELRKEKESEVKLRLGAEKQIELALQKTEEIERRMQDWRMIQDAVMKDSKEAIIKVGNDLYKKLSDNYKTEVETNKNLVGKVSKNIADFFDKFSGGSPVVTAEGGVKKSVTTAQPESHHDDPAKKLVPDLVSTMKANGHLVNKNYFLPANFDEQKAKLLLCEVAFIGSEKLYIIDFKACRYLEEYNHLKVKNKLAAESTLKQKLDKYLAYLSNAKYCDSILKVMSSTKAKFEKNIIVVVVPTKLELQVMKEVRYYDKAKKIGIEVMDFDGVNNLVI